MKTVKMKENNITKLNSLSTNKVSEETLQTLLLSVYENLFKHPTCSAHFMGNFCGPTDSDL